MSVNVRVSGALREHVERTTSEGDYESVSEYVRDLIRKDKAAKEGEAFERVKATLQAAFADEAGGEGHEGLAHLGPRGGLRLEK